MRAGGRILMIFGLLLGVIAGAAIFLILRSNAAAVASGSDVPTVESAQVIIAFQTIEPWQEIPIDAVDVAEYPLPLPTGAVTPDYAIPPEFLDPTATDVVTGTVSGREWVAGKISNTRIYPGQVIVATQLIDKQLEEQRLGLGSNLSYIVPEGRVAAAIPIDQISSIAGGLRSGDIVDIIATYQLDDAQDPAGEPEQVTQFFLQKVEILRVGLWSVQGSDEDEEQGGIVTVLVDPQQALELKFIRESTQFEFVLRSITDESDFVTEPVNEDYIIEQFNLAP